MDKEQITQKVASLFKQKNKLDEEIQRLQNELVQKLCPKGKSVCEPAYCMLRLTDSCPFIGEWTKILEKAGVPKDNKYDTFIEFVEKISEKKGVAKGT